VTFSLQTNIQAAYELGKEPGFAVLARHSMIYCQGRALRAFAHGRPAFGDSPPSTTPPGINFIQKPFSSIEILKKIREIFDRQ